MSSDPNHKSQRAPGSREEDAWLGDEQLARCAPAEEDSFQSPVPTRMVSNGEYMPHPQTQQQKQVEHRIQELADKVCKKAGVSRRDFLGGSGGMAAAFLAMNEVYGKAFFRVSEDELFDTAAAKANAPPDDLFVIDDQTHIVRATGGGANALRALAQGRGSASAAGGFTSNPFNGGAGNPFGLDELGGDWTPWNPARLLHPEPITALLHTDSPANTGSEFVFQKYVQRFFFESQTSVTVLSNANFAAIQEGNGSRAPRNIAESLQNEILTGSQTRAIADWVNGLAGSQRMLVHGQVYPGPGNLKDPVFGDYTQWQVDNIQPDSWKAYNIAPAAKVDFDPNSGMVIWRLDDEKIAYPIYQVIVKNQDMLNEHPGFFNICVHKGLSPTSPQTPEWGTPTDLPKAASDWPQLRFIIYHSCIRPSFYVYQSLKDINAGLLRRDTQGHAVPDVQWSTQFAQICAGLEPSSPKKLKNVYAELGTTFASMAVTFPTVLAHLMGQLLYYMGSDHIVFGSDSMWYGGPQWQIEALWRFQIPDDIADKWKYPKLTEHDKRQILGLNSARIYGLDGKQKVAVGQKGSAYKAVPANYLNRIPASLTQMMNGIGYPTPVVPAVAMTPPDDNFTKARKMYADAGGVRSNERHGWIRTRY
jgi:uncharacterized protein